MQPLAFREGELRLFVAGLLILGLTARTQAVAQIPQPAPAPAPAAYQRTAIVVGLGAIAGVVVFNAATLGLAALPGGVAVSGAVVLPAEAAVAVSRVYAVTTAVAGAWVADYLHPSKSATERLVTAGTGAVLGVTAFNVLTAPLGVVPWSGAVIAPIPTATMLGSRLLAAGSAGAGAIGATWLYGRMSGQTVDMGYAATLVGGALAGVAVGNVLSTGTLGAPPYYTGAGLAQAGGEIATASASAASRIWAVGTGAAGALAANYWYRK